MIVSKCFGLVNDGVQKASKVVHALMQRTKEVVRDCCGRALTGGNTA